MQKFLIVTEKPNNQASELIHEELFDLSKNFLWMHAKSSKCHGSGRKDGKLAIREKVCEDKFLLIATFGSPALKVFFKKNKANYESLIPYMKNGPIQLSRVKELLFQDIKTNYKDSYIVSFPHPSGNSQWKWMEYPLEFSSSLISTQKLIINEINNNRKPV